MVKKSEPSAPPLYPNLDQLEDSTKDEGKTFRLRRISDIRETLEKELEIRGRYRRRYKSAYNTAIYLNAGAGLRSFGHHETVRLFLTKFSYMVLSWV